MFRKILSWISKKAYLCGRVDAFTEVYNNRNKCGHFISTSDFCTQEMEKDSKKILKLLTRK